MAQAGYRVSLLAPHLSEETVDGVEITPILGVSDRLARRERFTRGIPELYHAARRLQADLYHFHDPELMPVGIVLKLTTDAKMIYDVHENHAKKILAREWIPTPLASLTSLATKALETLTASLVDGIVAVTEHIAVQFPGEKTCVVKNYPALPAGALTVGRERDHQDNHDLIYTGGFTNHRGLVQIVEALQYVETPGTQLILLGKAIDREAEETARELPGFHHVDYRGMLPYDEMYRHLEMAAVGLVCNQPVHDYHLAQPTKLFEYMSAGLPVVASDFALWREIVEGNNCGVTVDPTSPRQIADAIDLLLNRPDLRRRMGENGRRAILERYNWEIESQKLLGLYEEVLH